MNRSHILRRVVRFVAMGIVISLLRQQAHALNLTWNGGNGAWNTSSTNWSAATVPNPWDVGDGTGNVAEFATPGATVTVGGSPAAVFANGIQFDNPAQVTGGAVNFLTGGLTVPTVTVNASSGTISSIIAGSAGLVTSGTGLITLTGANTYTGGTTINSGTLQLNAATSAGPSSQTITLGDAGTGANKTQLNLNVSTVANSVVISGQGSGAATINYVPNTGGNFTLSLGSISMNGPATITFPSITSLVFFNSVLSGSGQLTIGTTDNQRCLMNGSTSPLYTGNIAVQSGAIFEPRSMLTTAAGNNITVNSGGELRVQFSTTSIAGLNGVGTVDSVSGAATLLVGEGNASGNIFSGTMKNNGSTLSFTKAGTGTQTLSGANIIYTGGTSLNQGTLNLTNATGFSSTVTMSNPSTLDLQFGSTGSSTWTFGQQINGGSANAIIQAVGPGTIVLNPASGSTFVGSSTAALTVTAGNLTLTSSFNTAPAVYVASAATFVDNSPGNLTTGAVSLAGGATLSGTGSVGATTVAAGGGIIGGSAGALTLASLAYSGTGTIQGFLGATTPIVVSGAVTASGGSGSIAVTAANLPTNGTYNLLSYGSGADPFSAFALNPPTRSLSLLDDSSSNLIQIVVNQAAYPIWTGLAGGDWSLATEPGAKNWRLNTGGTTDFLTSDTVVFDDSVGTAGTTKVTLNNGNVSPGSTTFNNTLYNYTLSGSNGIATGSLALNGSGSVTINTANSFGGGTTLSAGTLIVGNNAALGGGTLGINGGWLKATGGAITLPNNVTATSTLQVYTDANSLALNGTVTGGNLYKTGTGMLTLGAANNNFSGNLTVSQGTLQVGSIGASSTISLGDANSGASNVQLNINTASSITNPITVGNPASNPTTINVFGNIGTFNSAVTANGPLTIVGNGAPSNPAPTFSLSGSGTVTFSVATANEFIPLGNASSFTGDVVIAAPTNFEARGFLSSANGNNVTVMSGGTLQLISFGATTINALNGNGTVQCRNSTTSLTVGIGNGSGTFSGTMQNYQQPWTLVKTGTGTEELSGGNIVYTGATTLTQGTLRLTNATGFASAITMDPSNTVDLQLNASSGTAWTFSQQINGGSTNSIIEKVGSGTVVLNPASGSTFQGSGTGALTVTAGALYVANSNLNSFASPPVSVASGGTFGGNTTVAAVTVATGGGIIGGYSGAGQLILAGLTYSGTGAAAGVLSTGTPPIVVNGSVTANPASIAVSPTNLPADGTYPFLSYTGADPFSDFALSSKVVGRTVLSLVDSSGSDLIALTLTTSAYPIWSGKASGDWSLNAEPSPKNWVVNTGGATDFLSGDKVVFDDSVGTAGTTNVTLNRGNVNPGSVTFNNNLYNYTLSGTAGITTGSLTLNGTAAVTINTANSFGGGTTLNTGTLIVGNNSALGGGGLLINGGWLQPAGGSIALSNPTTASGNFTIGGDTNSLTLNGTLGLNSTGTSTITVNGSGGVVFANVVTGNNLVMSGTGMLTLSASNNFSGTVTVSQGVLQLNAAAAAGTAPITLGDGNSGSANMQLNINNTGVANAITVSGSGSGMATIAYIVPTTGGSSYSNAAQSITLNGPTTFTAPNLTGYLLFYPSLSGSGRLTIGPTNNQRLIVQTDQSSFTGDIEVQNGAVFEPRGYLDGPNGNNITVDSGGTLNVWFSPLVMNGLNGSGTVWINQNGGGPLTVGTGNGSGVFSGSFVVGGAGSPTPGLIKTGTGTQELSGAGINYTFATTLTQGTLRLTNATGFASPITMDSLNTVDLQLNNTSGTTWTFSQPINGGSTNSIIEKVGPGAVVLAPASGSTFQGSGSGALTVTQGALYLTNSNLSSFAPPPVAVTTGGTFGGNTTVGAATVGAGGGIVGGYSGAGQLTLAGLTYNGTGTAAGALSAGVAPIVVTGSVTANPASIAVSPTNLPADGTYPFLSYTGADPFSDFTLSTHVIGRTVLSLVDSGESDLIALTLTTSAYPIWTGKASGDWSLNTEPSPKNWRLNTGGATDFLAGDAVVFDDTVGTAGKTNVTLNNGDVTPGSVTFNNNLYNYTLSGTAGITTGSLTKNGSGTLTINTANSFGGGTTLNAGTLIVSNNSALGGGGGLQINGGWLQGAGGPIALPNNVTANGDFAIGAGTNSLTLNGTVNLNPTSGTSTITVNGNGGVVFANAVTGNNLVKSGAGLLDLAAANSFAGSVTVSQGTLQLNANAAVGAAAVTLGDANTGGNNLQLIVNSSSAANDITVASQATGTATISLMATTAAINWGSTNNTITLNRAATLTTPVETSYLQFNQALSGSGELDVGSTNAAQGGWIILFNQSPTFAGNVVIENNAVLEPRDQLSAFGGNNVTVQSGGTLQLITFGATSIAGLSGNGDVRCRYSGTTLTVGEGDASATFSGTMEDGQASWQLVKTGSGTQVLSGQNTFTGSTSINGGVINVGSPENPGTSGPLGNGGTISFGGGTLQYSSSNQYDYSSRFSTADGQVYSVDTNGQNVMWASNLTSINGSSLTKLGAGTLTLSGTNTYDSGTFVDAGTLIVASPAALADGSSLIVGHGVSTQFAPACAAPVTSAAAQVAAVPEPGTWALLLAALSSAIACYRFSRPKTNLELRT
jgi:fibronectin-binding autotransporter adhesin